MKDTEKLWEHSNLEIEIIRQYRCHFQITFLFSNIESSHNNNYFDNYNDNNIKIVIRISECSKAAPQEYKSSHEWVEKVILREFCKILNLAILVNYTYTNENLLKEIRCIYFPATMGSKLTTKSPKTRPRGLWCSRGPGDLHIAVTQTSERNWCEKLLRTGIQTQGQKIQNL